MSQDYYEVVSSNFLKNQASVSQNISKYSAKEPAHQHLEECRIYYHAEHNGIFSDEVELLYATETISSPGKGYNGLREHAAIPEAKALTSYMNQAIGLEEMVRQGVERIEDKTRLLLAITI